MSLSVVVLTKNEEENISKCLASVRFADEIVVIDDISTDETCRIARKHGAKIYYRDLAGDFAAQRNFGFDKVRSEWVLFLDADEVVSSVMAKEILQSLSGKCRAYYINRVDTMWGKRLVHAEAGSTKLIRLVKKNSGRWERTVHEEFKVKDKACVGTLKHPLEHFPHQSVKEFTSHVNHWSTLHALANKKEGKRASPAKIVFWPTAHFVRNYFFRLGFLDGMHGFVIAILMSFHSYLAWSKLYFIQKNEA